MKIYKKTWFLLVFCLVSIFGVVYHPQTKELDQLPLLNSVKREQVVYISLSSASEHIVLRKEKVWFIEQPIAVKADQMRVRALLQMFRKTTPMDLKVDEGNLSKYGLDANQAIVVELRSQEDEALMSMVVGADTEYGNTFVRLVNSNAVYRAKIGGRERYAHKSADWTNQVLFDFSLEDVLEFRWQLIGGAAFQLQKDSELWTISPSISQNLDHQKINKLLRSLGQLRIGRSVSSLEGFRKIASMELVLLKGREFASVFSNGIEVIVETSSGRFLVSAGIFEQLITGHQGFVERQIFKGISKEYIDRIQYNNKDISIEIQQDLSNGSWRLVDNAHKSLELKKIFFMINTLLSLEYESEILEHDRFDSEDGIEFIFLDGSKLDLKMGLIDMGIKKIPAVLQNGKIYTISEKDLAVIRQGFALE